MEIALIFLAGMVFGISVVTIIFRAHRVGTLRIDNFDPEDGPYMFLELEKGIGDISSKKHVILKVEQKNFISHK